MSIQANFPALKPALLLDFQNTKQLDPRITFTRASTATYYNGVTTAMAEQNLLTYSQEFDNAAWSSLFVTTTANTVAAPDGTTTADTVTATASTNYHDVEQPKNSAVAANTAMTISVYLKVNTQNFASLIIEGAGTTAWVACAVNLSTGAITQTGAGAAGTYTTSSITSVGNSWYRVSLTGQTTAVFNKFKVALNSSATPTWGSYANESWTAAGTESIYIWGAQLEQRSAVTAYTATTTQAITNYIPALQTAAAGVARFDCNPITDESLGLLIEEQRTNLVTYSEQFDNAAWTKTNATITANTVVAPDGTLTGDKLVENTTSSTQHYTTQQRSGLTAGSTYTFSVYAKAGGRSRFYLMEGNNTTGQAWFDVSTGTIVSTTGNGSPTSTITAVGNGWYKCTLTLTLIGTIHNCQIRLTNLTTDTYTGDGFSGVFLWGAQLEAGAFATSYIPTVASQVTRSADAASMTGTNFSSWYSAGEGTVYAETGPIFDTSYPTTLCISDNTSSNSLLMQGNNTSTAQQWYVVSGGSVQVALSSQSLSLSNTKTASAYKFNDYAYSTQGAASSTDTTALVPVVSQLNIGAERTSNLLNGTIKKIAYYPLRVTNANLQALTS